MSELSKSLGAAIKTARWKCVMKQKNLAKRLAISPSHLSEIEHGKKLPSIELLNDLEKLLGPIWVNK